MTTIRRTIASIAGAAGLILILPATPAAAHPLGNFTVNQHATLTVEPEAVALDLVVDMAEIPAFQTRDEIDTNGDKRIDRPEAAVYRTQACTSLAGHLALLVDGTPLPARVASATLTFPPGQAGLATLRLGCRLVTETTGWLTGRRIEFRNDNHTDRVGWREVVATGRGVALAASDVPTRSISKALTAYPEDLLSSPLDRRRATLVVGTPTPGGRAGTDTEGEAAGEETVTKGPLPRGADRFTSGFTSLVARQELTVGFGLAALAAAVALGALHALAPGHGKTVMAAYLIGERGSLRQALVLGATVTTTHTAGVLVLGLLLSGSTTFVPERVYPWLGVTSGVLLVVVGISLLLRAWRRRAPAGSSLLAGAHGHPHHRHGVHSHGLHGHEHDSHEHGHGHHSRGHPHPHIGGISRRALVAMGAAGGLVPSPSALVVLLGAIALGRTWFGVALVLGYGIGMALTLIAAGLLLVRARTSFERRLRSTSRWAAVAVGLPVATASLVVVAGVGLAAQAISRV